MLVIIEFTVEVRAVEIECVDLPVVVRGDGKDGTNTGEAHDWGVSVKIIDAEPLRESAGYEARFVLLDGSVGLALDAKYPLAAYDVLVGGSGNIGPGSGIF